MNSILEVIGTTGIVLCVATFLVNTSRGVKAIELCNECLILLDTKAPRKEQLVQICYGWIYRTMFQAYCLIPDFGNAIKKRQETS